MVVLRGLNLPADAKLPDFMPLKVKTPLHVMQLYGANVARVLFTWEAFEPTRGNYSMEYLDYYLGLVEVSPSITAQIYSVLLLQGRQPIASVQFEGPTGLPAFLHRTPGRQVFLGSGLPFMFLLPGACGVEHWHLLTPVGCTLYRTYIAFPAHSECTAHSQCRIWEEACSWS